MDSGEIRKEFEMTYDELVDHLLGKYGKAEHDDFCNEKCRSKNRKASRSSEGLYCHHIDEDKAIDLGDREHALDYPYEYQKADRLVYCNVLEHLMLHIKIAEAPRQPETAEYELPGIGGACNFMCPKLNDYYNGYEYKKQWEATAFSLIEDNFEDYIAILSHLLLLVESHPAYSELFNKEKLSSGFGGSLIDKIYQRL